MKSSFTLLAILFVLGWFTAGLLPAIVLSGLALGATATAKMSNYNDSLGYGKRKSLH